MFSLQVLLLADTLQNERPEETKKKTHMDYKVPVKNKKTTKKFAIYEQFMYNGT